MPLVVDRVDQAVLGRARGTHEVVAFGVALDGLEILASVMGQQLVQTRLDVEDFLGMDLDIGRLAPKPPNGW